MQTHAVLFAVSLGMLVTSCCGKEAGRIPFSAPGAASASMQLEAGDVSFWTDIDIEYEGPAALQYSVDLEQGGAVVASASCNPLGHMSVKTSWVETNVGNSHSRSGSGKMSCTAKLATAGATNVKATLAFASPPAKLKLAKADLVVKQ